MRTLCLSMPLMFFFGTPEERRNDAIPCMVAACRLRQNQARFPGSFFAPPAPGFPASRVKFVSSQCGCLLRSLERRRDA